MRLAFIVSFVFHGLIVLLGMGFMEMRRDLPLPGGVAVGMGREGSIAVEVVSPREYLSAGYSQTRSRKLSKPHSSKTFESGLPGGTGSGSDLGNDPLLAAIRSRIERSKRYPAMARSANIEGRVLVRFQIGDDGQPREVTLKSSSEIPVLDEEALATVRRAGPYPLYRDPLEIWIRFELQ